MWTAMARFGFNAGTEQLTQDYRGWIMASQVEQDVDCKGWNEKHALEGHSYNRPWNSSMYYFDNFCTWKTDLEDHQQALQAKSYTLLGDSKICTEELMEVMEKHGVAGEVSCKMMQPLDAGGFGFDDAKLTVYLIEYDDLEKIDHHEYGKISVFWP
ncbi:hypothetical protein F2P56_027206 [Juglans regia]|uniref:Uncharacterized protein n=1 Tax=Juglans regia TaxID=51240 RepID=A0A833U399_JUGRE|nr:hypothetical protein F2P56_027206 [Juglans regia]